MAICSISIASFQSEPNKNRPHVKVSLQNITDSWLYDTGAAATLIPLSLFRKVPPDLRPQKQPALVNLTTAGGKPLQTLGLYSFKLTIDNKTIIHPVYVCADATQSILGIDAIKAFGLRYSPTSHSFDFENNFPNLAVSQNSISTQLASLSVLKNIVIPPLTSLPLKVNTIASLACRPPPGVLGLATVGSPSYPYLNGGPGLVTTDRLGEVTVRVNNCAPMEIILVKGAIIGSLEIVNPSLVSQVDNNVFINAVQTQSLSPPPPLNSTDKNTFLNDLNLNVPDNEKQAYLNLLLQNHDVFSKNKNDLGKATNATHKIHLKNDAPIYVKQFPVPEAYREQLNLQVKEWLKMGIVTPTNSPYNSPIFVVPKKDGSPRYVLDFRKLNDNSHSDKYSMKSVEECIGDIGRSGSTIFSTLDLSSGFWQLPLDPSSQKFTAFTVQNLGQFQWTRTSQGLHSAPSQYQRLMELTVKGLHNIIVYIDDLLVHNSDHAEHRHSLQLLFDRLRVANLKLNLPKCNFGSDNVTYLGFRLTPQGILPGTDKLAAVKNATPPINVHQVRQFLGLANFFRTHIRNFSFISSPLNLLTRKDTPWRGGPLPPPALQAFNELKTALCSEPVVNYPRKDRPYALLVDAASGNDKNEGGLGAVLCQADPQGQLHVIAYASRSLSKHEKNYTPFLLEMTACTWGIDHFSVYLKGRKFTLYTDHKPLEKLSTVHTKTLNRLQQAMNDHDFVICHKPGNEMPADFLSRNVHSISSILDQDLHLLQSQDAFISELSNFIKHGTPPPRPLWRHYIQTIAPSCFFEKDILWRRISRHNMPHRNVLLLPLVLADELIHETHSALLSGHEGITRTKERLLQSYFWPNMESKISQHVAACQRCQSRRTTDRPKPPLLTSMPQCTSLNQRVAIDLMGPLRTSTQGKNYILCMTDAFTKYAEVCAIPNKEAPTVARAIFERWICRFGCPLEFTSDNGKEFCNELTKELFKLLNIKHSHTTPYHPQCNAQAEVQNKVIQKYLGSFVDKTTLDWPLYIAPMAFAYNTALHRSIKAMPFFLTFGIEPRLPSFPNPDIKRYYGQSDVATWYNTLHHCREVAIQNNLQASDHMQSQFNKTAAPYNYQINQLVWIDIRNYLGKNRKLSPHWEGPFSISRVFDTGVVEIIYKNDKKIRVNVARIKPFIPSLQLQTRDVNLPIPNDHANPNFNDAIPPQPPCVTQPAGKPKRGPKTVPHLPPAPPPPRYYPPPAQIAHPAPPAQPPPPPFVQPQMLLPPAPAPLPPVAAPPRPLMLVPQIFRADPPALPPPAAQPAVPLPIPDTRRVTRALRVQQNLDLHPPLAKLDVQSPFYHHQSVAYGPSLVSDAFGLPIVRPGFKTPNWIKKKRKFLKKLSVGERNFLLTGDPAFAYDPVAYDGTVLDNPAAPPPLVPAPAPAAPAPAPAPPPLIFQPPVGFRFRFGLQDERPPPRVLHHSSSSSAASTPTSPASPGPQQCLQPRPSAASARRVDNAAALMDRASLTDRPGGYWLRSSPTAPPTLPPAGQTPSTSTSSSSGSSSRFSDWRQRFSRLGRDLLDTTEDLIGPLPSPTSSLTNAMGSFADTLTDMVLPPDDSENSATVARNAFGRSGLRVTRSFLPRGRPRRRSLPR